MGLAEYVRTRRLRAGLTQEALAERAGLTVDTVGALERGLRRRLYPHTARALADALGLSEAERAELTALAHGPSRAKGARTPAVPPVASAGTAAGWASAAVLTGPDAATVSHNLPAPLTRLIGRERELALIEECFLRARLLTLTGTGGIGKTRLAIEAARALRPRYPDGVWLVELAPITDPALVLGTVASVLGVRETPGRPLVATLSAAVQDRHLLLVLDNFEQVLDAAPEIAAVLRACPSLAVLATSRAPLHIYGEQEVSVPPLAVPSSELRAPSDADAHPNLGTRNSELPDAVRLFVERASGAQADFALTPENAAAVAAICRRLDGIPLAIELAAAQVKLFPPRSLLTRLVGATSAEAPAAAPLRFLVGGPQDRPARQRTLQATIAWSYDLLGASEQALFRRLGVFVGGFTLDAAAAVCAEHADSSPDLIETLAALVDKSLVQRDDGTARMLGAEEAGTSRGARQPQDEELRFLMFETVREYALEQLAAEGEADRWGRRHFAHFLAMMERAEADLQETTPMPALWRTRHRLAPDQGNLRAALGWAIARARGEDALRLAASLCALWAPAGNLRVARRWLDQSAGTLSEARSWLEQALAIDGTAADAARAKALYGLGRVLLFQWEDPAAERDEAIRAFEQSLALYRRLDDRHGAGRCLIDLGWALFDQEHLAQAEAIFDESQALCRALDDGAGVGWSLVGLGRIAQAQRDPERAAALLEDGLAHHRSVGNGIGMAAALDGLGLARQAQGDYAQAMARFEEAVELRRTLGAQSGLVMALQRLAVLLGAGGNLTRAASLLGESLLLGQRAGNPWDIANALLSFGALAGGLGQSERGARLFGAGEALIKAKGLVVPDAYRNLYARAVATARRTLGEEAFAAEMTAGAALTLDHAITEALLLAAPDEGPAPAVQPLRT